MYYQCSNCTNHVPYLCYIISCYLFGLVKYEIESARISLAFKEQNIQIKRFRKINTINQPASNLTYLDVL